MTTEEARKLATRLRMPKFMRDTESCLEALVKFAEAVKKQQEKDIVLVLPKEL